ncbi:amino acid adenylation domain-containing protein [Paenibacillus tritici]|uniref:non-ribosomal peptide synthetase n=1 Tax=Paenibacillus tritici TaxID=1873425 RepID=UPI001BACF37A|nr:non-ribosomal peptide synthetase [Paenibacillus tritici]QUL52236.1 amino acid adenylation domain-containing protein [Paenibacillus tritici]
MTINRLASIEVFDEARQYWHTKLDGCCPEAEFVLSGLRTGEAFSRDHNEIVQLDEEVCEKLNKMSKGNDLSLYVLLLAAFKALLVRYMGSEDILIVSPTLKDSGQNYNKAVLLHDKLRPEATFRSILMQVKQTVIDGYANQFYPVSKLLEELKLYSNEHVFQYGFSYEAIHLPNSDEFNRCSLRITFRKTGNRLEYNVNYNPEKVDAAQISRMLIAYKSVLSQVLMNTEMSIDDATVMDAGEKEKLLYTFQGETVPVPETATITGLFEQQARKTPDHTAVRIQGTEQSDSCYEELTYAELDRQADQLAFLLLKKGVNQNSIVGVMVSPSRWLAVSLLAIGKAGAAYLPIDPEYPKERILYMIEDSGVGLVLGDEAAGYLLGMESLPQVEYLPLNEIPHVIKDLRIEEHGRGMEAPGPADLAYVIYTSGTTGNPKGTLIEHRNVVNTLLFRKKAYHLGPQDVTLQLFSCAFDGFVASFFTPLISGASVIILGGDGNRDMNRIREAIVAGGVTHFICVPMLLESMLEHIRQEDLVTLQTIVLAGDKVSPALVSKVKGIGNGVELAIEYGVTECSVLSAVHRNQQEEEAVRIGRPIDNTSILIVDKRGNLQPIGMYGELYMIGSGVSSRGYLGKENLTREKFSEQSYIPGGGNLYKTGDLGRWLPDGTIELAGRLDHQVKIRGYRIEPAEIERALLRHTEIKQAVVLSGTGGSYAPEQALHAYYVLQRPGTTTADSELRAYLRSCLPEYMVPAYFIELDEIALTPNGKVDTSALLRTERIAAKHIPPQGQVEQALAAIWADILEIPIQQISRDSNFFELGGHSLKLTALTAKVYKQMQAKLSISELFEKLTIQEQADCVKSALKMEYTPIERVREQNHYPLSSAQARLYFLHQLQPDSTVYNLSAVLTMEGDVHKEHMEDVFRRLIQRHEAFRTSFHLIEGEYGQCIHTEVPFSLPLLSCGSDEEDLEAIISDFIQPFDLAEAPLLRAGLIRQTGSRVQLVVNLHHIIADGVSLQILIEEFMALYSGSDLPEIRVSYKDYVNWLELNKQELEKDRAYWTNLFQGEIPVLELPLDYPRPGINRFAGSTLSFTIPVDIAASVKKLAIAENVSIFMVLLTVYFMLLNRLTGQKNIVVGSPIAGRKHDDLANVIGMFVNTLALKGEVSSAVTFKELLRQVRETTLKAYEHQDYPYQELIEHVGAVRTLNRNPLFDTMFMVQNTDIPELRLPNLNITPNSYQRDTAKFDLTLQCTEVNGTLCFEFEYATALFKASTVERFADYYQRLLADALRRPGCSVVELKLLSEEETERMLVQFNHTAEVYPRDSSIIQLIEGQVGRTPDAVAVHCGDSSITYKELNERSNRLARLLQRKGAGGHVVALLAERSIGAVVAILAVLKAGAAYVPIDPQYPAARQQYISQDSGAVLLLAQEAAIRNKEDLMLTFSEEDILIIEKDRLYLSYDSADLGIAIGVEDTAYIIYTSGSTGQPKGVEISHRGLTNYACWASRQYVRGEQLHFALFTSLSFDLTVTSLFVPLINGNAIIMFNGRNEQLLDDVMSCDKVGAVKLTPSHLKLLHGKKHSHSAIKRFIVGGESLSAALADEIWRLYGGRAEIFNEYGPTEATVGCMHYLFDPARMTGASVPIGQPAGNTSVYLLDKCLQPVPEGVSGEMYIAGDGLAKGYTGNQKLTAERFVDNPFAVGTKMYKTGDTARMADGEMIYLGREDQQLKVRGYRIEPGEVEGVLSSFPIVKETVVDVIDLNNANGDKQLIAYAVSSQQLDTAELRRYAAEHLPDHMVPAYVLQVDSIPLTVNGKLDKERLPRPDRYLLQPKSKYIRPASGVEEQIAAIWMEILQLDSVGADDQFFELGGNSMLLLKMKSRLEQEFRRDIPVADLFAHPTISHLARYLSNKASSLEACDPDIEAGIELMQDTIYNLAGDHNA